MNLSKQQLDAVAREIFKQLEIIVNKEKEQLSQSLLKNTKLNNLKKAFEQYEILENQKDIIVSKISKLRKDLGFDKTGYIRGYDYESYEKCFLDNNLKNLNQYKLEDIKDFILLASIEETDLTAIINAVTKKITTNNE
jgi:hypothetical protein